MGGIDECYLGQRDGRGLARMVREGQTFRQKSKEGEYIENSSVSISGLEIVYKL